MNLTGLNVICLETVLEYLDIADLLNAADSSTRLRHAARFVYERKFGEMHLYIEEWKSNERDIEFTNGPFSLYPDFGVDCIIIRRPKLFLQLLRCFGHLVPSIFCYCIDEKFRPFTALEWHFIDYIDEFCSKTLRSLNMIVFNWNEIVDRFKKPFKQVERISISNCWSQSYFSYQYPNIAPANDFLIRLFPRMQSLQLAIKCSALMHDGCIVHHIPNLENLNLIIQDERNCDTCMNVIKSLVRLNPQLKKIAFLNISPILANRINFISEYLQNVEYFEIKISRLLSVNKQISNFIFNALHLKRVKHLTACSPFGDDAFDNNLMQFINKLSFDNLETFTIQLATEPLAAQQLQDFCHKNQSIKQLKLIIWPKTIETVLRINSWLLQTLPLLVELEFSLYYFYKYAETTKFVHQTVTKILSTFEAIPTISINFDCPEGSFYEKDQHCCKIDRNFLNNFHDMWSTSWTDYKRKRLTFKRLSVPSKRKRPNN